MARRRKIRGNLTRKGSQLWVLISYIRLVMGYGTDSSSRMFLEELVPCSAS